MAENKYNIQDLFKLIWNYEALPYPMIFQPWNSIPMRPKQYDIKTSATKQVSDKGVDFYAKNALGIEVFMPITLTDPKSDSNGQKETKLFLENTIISCRLKKTIIETPLVNQQGTVKEVISIDDWDIDIKGIIVSPDTEYYNSYPDAAVKLLTDMVFIGNSLEIQNALTAICLSDNEKIVIKEFSLPEMRGVENAQAFELRCVSDLEFKLIID